jgi:antitoxin VapB
MPTAKVFQSGNSQAVRLPKEFRFKSKEVQIERRGDEVILREPRRKSTAYGRRLIEAIRRIPVEVFEEAANLRDDPPKDEVSL